MAFVTMAATYGVDLQELADSVWESLSEEALESANWMWDNRGKTLGYPKKIYLACEAIKWTWRQKHPKIVGGWRLLRDAAFDAVLQPGEVYGLPNKKILFKQTDRWLEMRLPSGRKLRYLDPEVTGEGRNRVLTYMGVDTETRQWKRTSTYGGKLTENACQASSADFLRYGMKQLEDESVSEAHEDWQTLDMAIKIYTRKPAWAKDFPLAAEGFFETRFQK
jgi:DNA polymerase